MTITIYEGYSIGYVLLGSKDERFHRHYGNIVRTSLTCLYATMTDIAKWVNNELGEECLFDID